MSSSAHGTMFRTLAFLAGLFAFTGCGSEGGGSAEPLRTTSSGVIVCGRDTYTDLNGASQVSDEVYVLPAINRRLSRYPELALALAIRSVSDCASARRFMEGYTDYSHAHPGFDDDVFDLNASSTLVPDLGPPPGPAPNLDDVEVPKILNGNPNVFNFPIVRISNAAGLCTGTFIAKNWILTSAHCLEDPSVGYFTFMVEVQDQNFQTRTLEVPNGTNNPFALQGLTHPFDEWMGRGDRDGDFALVYLYANWYDPILAGSADAGAMRISVTPVSTAQSLTLWGWGPSTQSGFGANLRQAPATIRATEITDHTFVHAVNTTADVSTCGGDSGGPATRPTSLAVGTRFAIQGILSGPREFVSVNCTIPGQHDIWTRVDNRINVLEKMMRPWNGSAFRCAQFPLTVRGQMDYARCWGTECSAQSQCPNGERCKGLIDPARGIRGQCLPEIACVRDTDCPTTDRCVGLDPNDSGVIGHCVTK